MNFRRDDFVDEHGSKIVMSTWIQRTSSAVILSIPERTRALQNPTVVISTMRAQEMQKGNQGVHILKRKTKASAPKIEC